MKFHDLNTDHVSFIYDLDEDSGMQALGIQGMALAINKVLLRKSFLTRFFISTYKTS